MKNTSWLAYLKCLISIAEHMHTTVGLMPSHRQSNIEELYSILLPVKVFLWQKKNKGKKKEKFSVALVDNWFLSSVCTGYYVYSIQEVFLGNTCVPMRHWACSEDCAKLVHEREQERSRQSGEELRAARQKQLEEAEAEDRREREARRQALLEKKQRKKNRPRRKFFSFVSRHVARRALWNIATCEMTQLTFSRNYPNLNENFVYHELITFNLELHDGLSLTCLSLQFVVYLFIKKFSHFANNS